MENFAESAPPRSLGNLPASFLFAISLERIFPVKGCGRSLPRNAPERQKGLVIPLGRRRAAFPETRGRIALHQECVSDQCNAYPIGTCIDNTT